MKKSLALLVVLSVAVSVMVFGGCGDDTTTTTVAGETTTTAAEETTSTTTSSETTASSAAASGPIKVGLLTPLTGFAADIGAENRIGVELALENASVAGRPIELFVEDSAGDPATSVTKAQRLVEEEGVQVIIGPYVQHTLMAVAAYLDEAGWIPQISSGGSVIEDMAKYSHLMGAFMTEETCTVPLAKYAYEKLGYRNAVVVGSDYAWGQATIDAFARGFEEAGGTVVDSLVIPVNTMEMGPYVTQIKNEAQNVDFVYDFVIASDNIRFHRQCFQEGLATPRLSSSEGIIVDSWVAQTGTAAVGCHGLALWISQVAQTNPAAAKYVDLYTAKTGKAAEDCDYYSAIGYMTGQIILHALETINGNAEDRDAFMAALLAVDIPADENVYRVGNLTIDPVYREPILDGYITKVVEQGGEPVVTIVDTIKDIQPKQLGN